MIAEDAGYADAGRGIGLAIALRADFPPERITVHGNNKSTRELERAVEVGLRGVGHEGHARAPEGVGPGCQRTLTPLVTGRTGRARRGDSLAA